MRSDGGERCGGVTVNNVDWRDGAHRLAQCVPVTQLEPSAVDELRRQVPVTDCVAVACSGGVDSLAALLLVWAHFPEIRTRLLVTGFDHRTRPECADEMRFVEAVTVALGAKFFGGVLGDAKCRRNAADPSGDAVTARSEADLREHRLAFFFEVMAKNSCRILVQGHQADDVTETLLMRLARGSGTAGLAAPRPVQRFADGRIFLRPLLTVTKKNLCDAMRRCGLPWCEDASNVTGDYLRNRIRNGVVPAWERAQGAEVTVGVLRSRRLLEEDDFALEAWLAQLWQQIAVTAARFDWRPLRNLPRALHRRALWRVLQTAPSGDALSSHAVETILDAVTTGDAGRWSVGFSQLVFDGDALFFEHVAVTSSAVTGDWRGIIFPNGKLFWPSSGQLEMREVTVTPAQRDAIFQGNFSPNEIVFLAPNGVDGGLRVRTWRAGDAYHALGARGSRKLSDMFVDKKIPVAERHASPVVCDNKGVLWVPGLPPAERCRLDASAEKALQLTWTPAPLTSFAPKNESVSE